MKQPQRGWQKRFQRHCTRCGLFKRQSFALFVLGGVHRADNIDQPALDRLNHGLAILFRAQRWLDLKKGAVVGNVQLVQGQVMDRCASGDI